MTKTTKTRTTNSSQQFRDQLDVSYLSMGAPKGALSQALNRKDSMESYPLIRTGISKKGDLQIWIMTGVSAKGATYKNAGTITANLMKRAAAKVT